MTGHVRLVPATDRTRDGNLRIRVWWPWWVAGNVWGAGMWSSVHATGWGPWTTLTVVVTVLSQVGPAGFLLWATRRRDGGAS